MNRFTDAILQLRVARQRRLSLGIVCALVAGLVVFGSPASPALGQSAEGAGIYVPLSPQRILDTRQAGNGGVIAAQATRDVQVGGLAGVPTSGVVAVVLDLTVVNNTSDGWGLAWAAATPKPALASTIAYVPGRAVTNAATVKVGTNGKVSYFTWSQTDLIVDVVGYYRSTPGGGYVPITQTRIQDTRTTGKLVAGTTIDHKLRGVVGIPNDAQVKSVVLNVSAFDQEAAGYMTVHPSGTPRPGTSSMNFSAWRMQTQMMLAPLSSDGYASFYVGAATHLLFDVVGYYTDETSTGGAGAAFKPLDPKRLIDTRYHLGWGVGPINGPLPANGHTQIKVTGMHGVPTGNVSTVLMTVTADATSSSAGFLSVWASGEPLPGTISLTYYPNEDTSNLVMAKVGTDGNIMVTNYTGITHLVIDIVGYFSTDLNSTPTSSSTSSTSTSTSSTTSTTMGLGRPSQVQGVAAFTQSSRTIAVHWDSAPASEQVTAFRISPSPACSSCGGLTAGVTNSSTVTGLRPGTEYVFRVIATNAAGDSDPSTVTVASRATTFAEAPSAPTEVNATASHSKVTVSWSEPDELNGSRLLGYTVIVSPDCPCSGTIVDPAVTESVITGLTDGEQYTFTVQASSDSGTSISTDFDVATPVPLLRVMTWNIKRGMESEGPTSDGEPGRFASEIAAQHADVVGFQEITETQAERIAQLLGWGPPHWIETKDPEVEVEPGEELCFEQILLRCRQFGNAIISRYPLEEIDFWRLPVAAVEEGLERRALLRAVVTLVGGFRVHLYDTHLASGSPEESNTDRNRQALAIVDRVNTDRSGEGHRAVLLGDLNSKPGDPTLEPPFPPDPAITTLNGPLQDAWTAVYPDPNTRPPGYTSTPTNPHQRIDYVFNDRSSPVPVEGAQVGTSIGLSDHHWLWADL